MTRTIDIRRSGTVICILLISIALHYSAGLRIMQNPKIIFGDGIEYIDAAYHLFQDGVFTSSSEDAKAPPSIGREPAYPLLLAALMRIDPDLASYRPACADPATGCDPARFRVLSVANLLLIEATAVISFALAVNVTGSEVAGLVAAEYFLLNVSLLRSHWSDPVSDELALLLVAAAMLAVQQAWGRTGPFRWSMVGLTLAALTLTKAVFLPFSIGVAGFALGRLLLGGPPATARWRRPLIAMTVYGLVVGGWMARNWQVSGMFRLTDDRGGIALSTREVFDHMTAPQIAAAFVYWTPGGGTALAKRLFSPETVAPFDLYAPGGFYDRGQNGYARRVDALMQASGVDVWTARSAIDHAVIGEILQAPLGYIASCPPLIYRGLWFDQFAILSLPLLIGLMSACVRRRDILPVLLLSFGLFNELFYALFSLNIPRYQITAMPALALAVGLGVRAAERRMRSRATVSRSPIVVDPASPRPT